MSLTLITYLIIFTSLAYMAIMKKPVWGVSLYIFNLLIFPRLWWWGKHFPISRWSLIASCILLAAVCVDYSRNNNSSPLASAPDMNEMQIKYFFFKERPVNIVIFLMILNYSIVHFIIAGGSSISSEIYFLVLKFLFLLILIKSTIKKSEDHFIIFFTILICLGYLGYQVWTGAAGDTVGGRLENLPVPSAQTSNLFASILVLFLPSLGALFFLSKRKTVKILSVLCFPFILNIIFLLNSRGAYLGLIVAFCSLFLIARKKERKILAIAAFCGLFVVPLLAKDEKIYERFTSIFVEQEQRDYSAQSRFIFWGAALDMVSDHPFGLGGHAFKKMLGLTYLRKHGVDISRSIHNGYLDIATQWGIQGLFLHLLLIYLIFKKALKAAQYQLLKHDAHHESFFIKACLSGMVGFCASSMFSNTLDEEWLYWMLAMLLAYINLVLKKNDAVLKF